MSATHPEIQRPRLGRNVYIAPTSFVAGDVTLADDCTVMQHVVIRADIAPIRIGQRVNVQDGSVIHTKIGVPLDIGDDVAIGHRAVVHCRRVGPRSLIAIGAIVLDDAEIGADCVIGAGAVVPPGTIIPDGKLVLGMPGRVVRNTGPSEHAMVREIVENYLRLGREYSAGRFPNHCD